MADEMTRPDRNLPKSALSLLILLSVAALYAQIQGERPPAEILRLAQPALNEGRRAPAAEDAVAVRVAVAKAILALGPWAGNPETATRYGYSLGISKARCFPNFQNSHGIQAKTPSNA